MMKTSLSTSEHCFSSNSVWDNTSMYDHDGYHGQQQYQYQYANLQISYDDNRQYGANTGCQYRAVPGAAYRSPAAEASGPGPCFDDSVRHRNIADSTSASAQQPNNMATAGSYASSGTGSSYDGGRVDARKLRQLPDVVGGHLQGWMNHGPCTPQHPSQHQPGQL